MRLVWQPLDEIHILAYRMRKPVGGLMPLNNFKHIDIIVQDLLNDYPQDSYGVG